MAAHFDGSSDSLTLAAATRSGSWSFAVWVQLAVDRNDFVAYGPVFDSAGAGFYMGLGSDDDGTSCSFFDNDTNALGTLGGPGGKFAGMTTGSTWHFTAASYNSSTGAELLCFGVGDSGSSVAIRSATRTGSKTGTAALYIGNNSFGNFLNGAVKQVRIWQAVLTQAEFEAEWSSPTAVVRTSNLFGYWPLSSDATVSAGTAGNLTTNGTVVFDGAAPAAVGAAPVIVGQDASTIRSFNW